MAVLVAPRPATGNLYRRVERMFKKILLGFVDQPVFTSLFVADFALLVFHRPPFLFSIVMIGALVGMSMYMGQKLAIFEK
jgi:hypothetical protein